MLSAREPEWEPLLNFAPDHVGDFMWMYTVQLADGTRLQAYKHYWTRGYLHLDNKGRAFVFAGKECYEAVNPPWLLSRVLNEELDPWLSRYSVRQNVWPAEPIIKWRRSATRHRISRERSQFVIEHCGLQRIDRHRNPSDTGVDQHVLFLGDDLEGVALEVVAAELGEDEFAVIHAMTLRRRFAELYEEAKRWQR
jgi:hypothetical protein